MSMIPRTFNQVVQRLIAEMLAARPEANLTIGTLARDVMIDVPAWEFADLYEALEDVQDGQSINTATGDALDALLENFSLKRKNATRSTGTVWFRRTTAPTSDLLVAIGTRVSTASTATSVAQEFATKESVVMLASEASTYWNEDAEVYEIEINIEAVEAGSDGNVGAGLITVLSGVAEFTSVYNSKPTTGGTDQEGDDNFRLRGLTVLSGNAIGSADGYKTLVEQQADVIASAVVTPNADEGVRIQDGGGADIYIRTETTGETTDSYAYSYGEVRRYFTTKPLLRVSSVKADGSYLVPGLDYVVDYNTGVYSRSVYSPDRLRWLLPRATGETIEITYTYSLGVVNIQALLDEAGNHVVGVDILVKRAYYATVDLDATVELFSGYNATTVVSTVNNAVTAHINNLGLGDEVQQSDIVAVMEAVDGVDSVVLPFATFTITREVSGVVDEPDELEGESTYTETGNLAVRLSEYPTAGTITVRSY